MNDAELMVLPLVVRIERATPPERTDALEAAAAPSMGLLSSPAAWAPERHPGLPAGKIRKLGRRARGAECARPLPLPGRRTEHRGAGVRVPPPVPLDAWPRDLARLQVSGTELA